MASYCVNSAQPDLFPEFPSMYVSTLGFITRKVCLRFGEVKQYHFCSEGQDRESILCNSCMQLAHLADVGHNLGLQLLSLPCLISTLSFSKSWVMIQVHAFMMRSISLLHRSPASSKLEAKRDTVQVYPWSPSLPVHFPSRLLVLQASGSAEVSTAIHYCLMASTIA